MKRLIIFIAAAAMLCTSCTQKKGNLQSDDSKLKYSPELTEVGTIILEKKDFPMQLLSNGKLSARQKSALSFRQSGAITKVNYSNGAKVQAGALIAELDNRDQQSALESAAIARDKAELDLKDVLVGLGYTAGQTSGIPEEIMAVAKIRSGYSAAINAYETAVRNLEGTKITAPFSGKVADIKLKVWDSSTADPFCSLIADDEFDVDFTILESEYGFAEVGQSVRVTLFSGSETATTGNITSINPSIDKNGQIAVKARIKGKDGFVDGMNVRVLVDKIQPEQLVVPKSAVVIRDGLEVLFRYNAGKAEWVYVNILKANSESYAVIANEARGARLEAGDEIIVSGNLNLADGSNVVLKK